MQGEAQPPPPPLFPGDATCLTSPLFSRLFARHSAGVLAGRSPRQSIGFAAPTTLLRVFQGTYKTYHLDGDKNFDEERLKMARMALFTHPQLQRQLEAYWRLSVSAGL